MTREEAIDRWVIPAIKNTWNEKKCSEIIEALKLIPEQEPFMNKPCVAYQVCHEDKVKVLDKIRTEIEKEADISNRLYGVSEIGLRKALKIIDKYRAESEELDADSN